MTADVTVSFTTSACTLITVAPTTVPGGTVNLAYTPVTFFPTGGTPPITWSVTSGTLPTGMNLSAAGVLSGTPTQAGAFPLTITATASGGCTGSVSLTLNIASGPNVGAVVHRRAESDRARGRRRADRRELGDRDQPRPARRSRRRSLTFNVTGNTNPRSSAQAGGLADRHADLHAGRQRQRHGDDHAARSRTTAAPRNGGVDTSAPQTFTITVTAVNDAPSFTEGAESDACIEDAGAADGRRLGDGDQRGPGQRVRPDR